MGSKSLASKVAAFLLLFVTTNAFAVDLSLPGRFWAQYERDVENRTRNDIQNGRIMGHLKQGVKLNNTMLFAKVNVYNPFSLLIDRDNYYALGISQQVKFVEFGIAREFVRYSPKDYNRYSAFINIQADWDLKK